MTALDNFIKDAGRRQEELFHYTREPVAPEEFAERVRNNVLACVRELMEVLDCVQWKNWAKNEGVLKVTHDELADEVADALLFLGNVCWWAGVSDAHVAAALDRADVKVRSRVQNGYEARRSS